MSSGQEERDPFADERKGGVRIQTDLWVRVVGRDSEPIRRTGNICGTGFFFEAQDWRGRPGDIGVMEISSDDLEHTFTTMASLVRVVGAHEARWGTATEGVSYQFLPSDEATRMAIARTVRHMAEQHPEQAGELVFEDFQEAAVDGQLAAVGKQAMPCVESGSRVKLVVDSPTDGSKREVIGVVGDITESVQSDGVTRFWIPVFMEEESSVDEAAPDELLAEESAEEQPSPAAAAIEQSAAQSGAESLIDSMWKELVPQAQSTTREPGTEEPAPPDKSHLSGRLSEISMPSALWLLDQESLTGALEFRRDGEEMVLYLREGRVIDAESPAGDRDPRALLAALLGWEDGQFEFRVEQVDREDRIGVPTQGLLLDLSVERDEAAR